MKAFVDELIPSIDQKYRTISTPEMRANMGCGFFGGFAAFNATFSRPETVGKLAIQSMWWDSKEDQNVHSLLTSPQDRPLEIYLAWGRYDLYSPLEVTDIRNSNQRVAEILTTAGYAYRGGEFNDGYGWISWRSRTDSIFNTLFPLEK